MIIRQFTLLLMLIVLFSGCRSLRFSKNGIFVNEVDRYFNKGEDGVNVWLYTDFIPYNGGIGGLRMDKFYEKDKEVLKFLNITKKHSRVLFSAAPESNPRYHLIAIRHKNEIKIGAEYLAVNYKEAQYAQKDMQLGRLDIRHIYIPIPEGGGLSLVYYISTEQHFNCRFCKLDYLAGVNAIALQYGEAKGLDWQISNCYAKEKAVINPVLKEVISRQIAYFKIYIDFENGNKGIQYFKVFQPKDNSKVELLLCKEKYTFEYLDHNFKVLYKDSLNMVH